MNDKQRELLRTVITSTIKQDSETYKTAWKEYVQSKGQEITNSMLGIQVPSERQHSSVSSDE